MTENQREIPADVKEVRIIMLAGVWANREWHHGYATALKDSKEQASLHDQRVLARAEFASALSAHDTAQRAAAVEACKNAVCEHCRKNIPICKTWRDFHQYEGFVAQCLAAAIRNGEGTT